MNGPCFEQLRHYRARELSVMVRREVVQISGGVIGIIVLIIEYIACIAYTFTFKFESYFYTAGTCTVLNRTCNYSAWWTQHYTGLFNDRHGCTWSRGVTVINQSQCDYTLVNTSMDCQYRSGQCIVDWDVSSGVSNEIAGIALGIFFGSWLLLFILLFICCISIQYRIRRLGKYGWCESCRFKIILPTPDVVILSV